MPGFRTHFIFGKISQEKFKFNQGYPCIREHQRAYQLGQQGPDIFFYYLPSVLLYQENIGTIMHNRNIMQFFSSLFEARKIFLTKHSREIADSYIMGFIGHYTLDTIAHPYIQYRVKRRQNADNITYAHGNHVQLETDIDIALQKRYLHLEASEFHPETTIDLSFWESIVISRLLAHALRSTYPKHYIPFYEVFFAIKSTQATLKALHDPHNYKKKIMHFIDRQIFHHAYYSSAVANDQTQIYEDPLNLRHYAWHNPWNEKIKSNQDFLELFSEAGGIYAKRLDMYRRMNDNSNKSTLFSKKVQELTYYRRLNLLLDELGNVSYSKGITVK